MGRLVGDFLYFNRVRTLLLLLSLLLSGLSTASLAQPAKIIRIEAGTNAVSRIGRDTVLLEDLSRDIHVRLWKSFLGTGRTYDRIELQVEEGTTEAIRTALREAIRQGQQKALDQICLEKNKKVFARISGSQQQKMRKKFPVLFQSLSP